MNVLIFFIVLSHQIQLNMNIYMKITTSNAVDLLKEKLSDVFNK